MFVSLAAVTLAVQLGSPVPTPTQRSLRASNPVPRLCASAAVRGWLDLSARDGLCTRTVILRRKIRQPGNILPVYRSGNTHTVPAMAPTSIFGMAYVPQRPSATLMHARRNGFHVRRLIMSDEPLLNSHAWPRSE